MTNAPKHNTTQAEKQGISISSTFLFLSNQGIETTSSKHGFLLNQQPAASPELRVQVNCYLYMCFEGDRVIIDFLAFDLSFPHVG